MLAAVEGVHSYQEENVMLWGEIIFGERTSASDWIKNRSGKTTTNCDIPAIVKVSLPTAITPKNNMSGFAVRDISPYNHIIFTDRDFDRPEIENEIDHSEQKEVGYAPNSEYTSEFCRASSSTSYL